MRSIEKYNFIDLKTIFSFETVDDLRQKEEKFEKKIRQSEFKRDKKERSKSKSEKTSQGNNKNRSAAGNMKIDELFSRK